MTCEHALFFQVLKDYMNGKPTELPPEADLVKLCDWAKVHKLGGIFFAQCGLNLMQHPAIYSKLQNAFGSAVYQAATREKDYAELKAAFTQAGIPFIPVKGAVIAPFYPDPQLRTMSDLDLVVRTEDKERIRDVLTPLGFRNKRWSDVEWHYARNTSLFELQAELIRPNALNNKALQDYINDTWSHAVSENGSFRLNDSFHFLYLMVHIAKHLRIVGIGFRSFYDLAILMQRCPERLDWKWIRTESERLHFFRFVMLCLAMTERWFDVPSPFPTDELTDTFFNTMTEKIFANGVFGFNSADNTVALLSSELVRSGKDLSFRNRIRVARKLAFPPYRDLILSSKYGYLKGHPWLLPCAWVHRAVQGRKSTFHIRELSKALTADKDSVRERIDYLDQLGI